MGGDPRGSTSSPGRESKLSKLGTGREAWKGSGLLSVCLSVCLGLSPRPLLPLTPSSSALHPPLWVRGTEGRCRWLWHFLPRKLLLRSSKGLELRWGEGRGNGKCGQGSRLLRAEAGLGERGRSLFLGKPPLTTPAPGDCPLP